MSTLFSPTGRVLLAITLGLGLVSAAPTADAQTPGQAVAIPQGATALEGTPEVRVEVTKDGAIRRTLDAAEAARDRLTIKIVDGRLYWGNPDRPLTMSSSGNFTYVSAAAPGRYVRFRQLDDRLTYVEHVDMAFSSVTYWGELRFVLGK